MIQIQRFAVLLFIFLAACQSGGPGPEFVAIEKSKLMEGITVVEQKVFPPLSPKQRFQYPVVDVYTLNEWFKTKQVTIVYFNPDESYQLTEHKKGRFSLVRVADTKALNAKIKKTDYVVFSSAKEKHAAMTELALKADKAGYQKVFVLDGGEEAWLKIKEMALK